MTPDMVHALHMTLAPQPDERWANSVNVNPELVTGPYPDAKYVECSVSYHGILIQNSA